MKRAFPQNPKSVSSPFPNIPVDGMEQDQSGNNCRFKTSAAVLGLALSVGASGTFLARPGEALGTVIPKDALALASATPSDKLSGATSGSGAVANVFHTVAAGETVWEIALAHAVDVQDIKSANGIAPGEVLKVGQVLRVPAEAPSFVPSKPVVSSESVVAAVPEVATAPETPNGEDLASQPRLERASELASAPLMGVGAPSQSESPASVPAFTLPLNPESESVPSVPTVGFEAEAEVPLASAPEADWANQSVLPTSGSTPNQSVSAPTGIESALNEVNESPQSQVAVNEPLEVKKTQQFAALNSAVEESGDSTAVQAASDSLPLYEVRSGDSLWAIASAHGVSPDKLLQHNPQLTNPNLIRAGQSLRVPAPEAIAVRQPTPVTAEPREIAQPEPAGNIDRIREAAANPIDREQLYAWIQSVQQRTASVGVAETAPETVEAESLGQSAPAEEPVEAAEPQDPHVASLISEIRQLQRQQPVAVAAVTTTPEPFNQAIPDEVPVNPEFSPEFEPDAEALAEQERLMAAAPLSSEAYMPRPVVPVGQTVSPELPILPQPSEFLPEAPNRFDGYIWPAQGVLTSGYGWRWGRMHHGVDVAGPVGTPIFAAASGVVVRAGWNSGGYGNLVDIRHPDGSLTRYAHNSRLNVRQGQEVRQGQQIAEMGSTGYSTGPHLHFEIHVPNSGTVNPIAYLPNR